MTFTKEQIQTLLEIAYNPGALPTLFRPSKHDPRKWVAVCVAAEDPELGVEQYGSGATREEAYADMVKRTQLSAFHRLSVTIGSMKRTIGDCKVCGRAADTMCDGCRAKVNT